jgi:hypothetical protein
MGNFNRPVISESEVSNEMIKSFLVSMLLTMDWGEEFANLIVERNDKKMSWAFHDYLHRMKLLKFADDIDYKYEISVRGRRWLDKFNKGEKHEQ